MTFDKSEGGFSENRAEHVYRTNDGAFLLTHSLSSALDSNSATSMRSIAGVVSPTCRVSSTWLKTPGLPLCVLLGGHCFQKQAVVYEVRPA